MAQRADNQIQPVARPVQAFIEPVRVNVVEPARPAQLPGFGQVQTVQQGATPSVQGYNHFEQLAGSLEAFNRQLTPVLQQIGLQYADSQMRQGEARARAEALRGMAQNDAAMENAEAERNKANRALAKKDPQAAGIMALLNPYAQIGYERGKARLAGAEVAVGLPEYVRQNADKIDYTTPDQGQGATRQLADEFATGLLKRYGLSADNPMAQRFVLPEVEKAREKVGLQIAQDRSEFLNGQRIDQTTAMIRNVWSQAASKGVVEWNGQTYRRDDPTPEKAKLYPYALRARMQELLGMATRTGVMPGDARKIQEKIYESLNAQGWYGLDGLRSFVNSLESTDKLLDPNGKEVIDPSTGKPVYLTLGSIYQQKDIDNEIRYKQARAAARRIDREDEMIRVETYLYQSVGGTMPGPEREAARTLAIAQYWNANRSKLEAAGVTLLDLQKKAQEIGQVTSELYFEDQPNPDLPERALAALSQVPPADWNANDAYRRGEQIAASIRDPKKRGEFQVEWNNKVRQLDKENTSMSRYQSARDSAVNQAVNANLNTYYGPSDKRNQGDRSTSRSRQWQAFIPYVNAALTREEAKKGGGRLNDAEVRAITTDVLGKYGSGPDGQKQKEWLYPGSPYTDTPGVTPRTKPRNQGVGPAQGPARSTGAAPTPTSRLPERVYDIKQLDTIPDRKIVLRNYEKQAVLSAGGIDSLIQDVTNDRPWPKQFERAWRDAGAKNGGEFIMRQIEQYPGTFELPPKLQRKIQQRAAVQAGAGDYMVSLQAAQQRFPELAALAGGLMDVVTGARPASAAVRFESAAASVSHPTLDRLATGRLARSAPGYCVTAVLDTLQANKLPNPPAAGGDPGNNPRGLASQLVRQYGWQSLPGLGQEQIIQSPYGTFSANVIPEQEYLAAVRAGRIPSGALVFSTRHSSWQGTSPGSRGYDVAIARNGGRNLWNGSLQGSDVYSGRATQRMVLIPKGASIGNLSRN